MVEASQWYSLISVGSSSLALLAAAYVVRKIPNRRAGDTFVLAMVFFVLAGTFAYLLRTSTLDYYGTNSGPLAIARLFYFFHMLAVGFTASFIGQYFLGFELMRRRLVNLFLQVSLLIVAIGVTTQVTTLEDEYGGIGVVVEDAWARGSLALFATLFMSTALAVLAVGEAVRLGSLGLVITRRTPTEVRDDYDLPATPTLWLTSVVGQNRVPPTNPELIERLVREFVASQPKAVVLLEGIEYLSNYLEAARVVRLVNSLRDLVTAGDGVLLASADPTALDEATAGVLDREFEPLAVREKVGYEVEDVFVIEGGGLLLTHATRSDGAENDPDAR